jgi:hypothetical protein
VNWLYVAAAACTAFSGAWFLFVVPTWRAYRWVRLRADRIVAALEDVDRIRTLVVEHDQALVRHHMLPPINERNRLP